MERVDNIVVGAGVVGLAVARALACGGRETMVLERARAIGTETSSRNSEVIHAGIYYATGSLKARHCVRGKQLLYGYLSEHGIDHRRCGKLIVATTDAEVPKLRALIATAAANGVADLTLLDRAAARELEPALECVAAVHSLSTGIVDSHGYMLALQGDLENAGGLIAFGAGVSAVRCASAGGDHHHLVRVVADEGDFEIACATLVNAAGLTATRLARRFDGLAPEHVPPEYFAKGNYYSLSGRSPFSRLIYPVPEAAGLGVHLTIDLGGQARFGPDVEWIDVPKGIAHEPLAIDYDVDPSRALSFYREIRRYWPELPDGALSPGYAGVRPKIQAPGDTARDFVIQGPARHGVPGLVNLFGIESPGLTASLAIAEHVEELVGDYLRIAYTSE